jgi:anaerobic magnesium-protoporphyrin IX monomethyl ester cyclase
MRIVLVYPPPWKISAPGESQYQLKDGPPKNYGKNLIDNGDFLSSPYGLLSLAAQSIKAGHEVLTVNLSNFAWRDIELLIRHVEADLFGLSCYTINRRGVSMLAQFIREVHPEAHIVCGGPFVTALPKETLEYYKAIDTVVIGEGEETFLELIRRLEAGESSAGLAGTAWRSGRNIHIGLPRKRIDDLDSLSSPLDYFHSDVLITSRGCPGKCTFCGARAMWGRKLTFHSVDYVLDMLRKAVDLHGQKFITIMDDTFTSNRRRVLAICQGIIEQKLNFIWSCHTRVDALDEELLRFMRLAGCQRLGLGVESASPLILNNIKKLTSPEMVLEVTRLAKKYGFEIRYYMMTGNRGETIETIQQSLDFIKQAQPTEFAISHLSIYPGTEEFDILQEKGVKPDIFFKEDFIELYSKSEDGKQIWDLLGENKGHYNVSDYSVDELEAILERLHNHPAAHIDLAGAYCRAGQYDKAERHVRDALDLNYPLPGLAFNYLACIAAAKHDYPSVWFNLIKAYKFFPHQVVQQNMKLLAAWYQKGGMDSGIPLILIAHNLFELVIHNVQQPVTPGPITLNIGKGKKIYNLGPDVGLAYHHGKPLIVQSKN